MSRGYEELRRLQHQRRDRQARSWLPYGVEHGRVVIGRRTYALPVLYVLAYLTEFLSVALCFSGAVRIASGMGTGLGVAFVACSIACFLYGLGYRKVATAARGDLRRGGGSRD